MENIAHNCLTELVERCVVQVGRSGSTGTIKTCQIHDLIRDFQGNTSGANSKSYNLLASSNLKRSTLGHLQTLDFLSSSVLNRIQRRSSCRRFETTKWEY
ncbi:unnamed protein product [Prunus armeniaca]